MRLSQHYRSVITREAQRVFGKDVQVLLFGSRVDDKQRGGDIDLYLITTDHNDLRDKRRQFLASVKRQLGEQKIDVVFNEDENRLIEQEARRCGILL